jgi:hypothetical protein
VSRSSWGLWWATGSIAGLAADNGIDPQHLPPICGPEFHVLVGRASIAENKIKDIYTFASPLEVDLAHRCFMFNRHNGDFDDESVKLGEAILKVGLCAHALCAPAPMRSCGLGLILLAGFCRLAWRSSLRTPFSTSSTATS